MLLTTRCLQLCRTGPEVFIKLDDLNGSSKIVHLGDPYSGRYDGTSKFYPSCVVRVITFPMEV